MDFCLKFELSAKSKTRCEFEEKSDLVSKPPFEKSEQRRFRVFKLALVLCLLVLSFSGIFLPKQISSRATSGGAVLLGIYPFPASPPNSFNSVSIDPQNNYTYVAAGNLSDTPGAIYIFDESNKTFTNSIYVASGGSGDLDLITNLYYFANQGNASVTVVSLANNSIVNTIPIIGEPTGIAADPIDGMVFISSGGVGNLQSAIAVVNESSNSVTYIAVSGTIGRMCFDQSNKILYATTNSTNTLEVAPLNGTIVGSISNFIPGALDSSAGVIYGTNPASGNFTAVSVSTGSSVILPPLGVVGGMALNSNTNKLYVSESSGDLAVLNTATEKLTQTVPQVGFSQAVGVNSATNLVYAADEGAGTLSIIYDPPTSTTTSTSTSTVTSRTTIFSTSTTVQTTTSTSVRTTTTTSVKTTTRTSTETSTATSTAKTTTTSTSLSKATFTTTVSTTATASITKTDSLTTTAVQTLSSTDSVTDTVSVTTSTVSTVLSNSSSSSAFRPSSGANSSQEVVLISTSQTISDTSGPVLMNLDIASLAATVVAGAGGALFLLRRRF